MHTLVALVLLTTAHAAVSPKVDPTDPRDIAYCEEFFTAPASSNARFSERDPANGIMTDWLALAERGEKTWRSLSQDHKFDVLERQRFALVFGFVKSHLDNPNALTLHALYGAYLNAYWTQLTWYRRVENPSYFDDEDGPVGEFEEFHTRRLANFKRTHPQNVSLAGVLARVYGWLPTTRADRVKWLRGLTERKGSALLGDVLVGRDPIAAIRREIKHETYDPQRPNFFTDYSDFDELWRVLKPNRGERVVDLTAGEGRAGVTLHARVPRVEYLGFERLASRVGEAEAVARELGLKPADWNVMRADVTTYDFPQADIYVMENKFLPSELERIWTKLAAKARAGEAFTVVMAGVPMFAEAARYWPDDYASFDTIFPNLPAGFDVEKPVLGFDENFFVVSHGLKD